MLLINPAIEKFGGILSRYVPVGIPVGIGTIAAYLDGKGIRCNVIDEEIHDITPATLREKVEGLESPYVFGITCLTAHVARAYQIAGMIKKEFPDSYIILGGNHATVVPEEALSVSAVDFVVRGEGEEIMFRLLNSIRGDGDFENNLIYF